ncbi:MAG: alpha/beta hydrolase [Anaerolineales bacterium]|nr:alpha/beta hydrolase [Anaerolineales bacterium]MCB0008307.1 alpha/beta hydrolase [Anaerolineales bacterium]MCB0013894.1 alpha/beta hydrolase [Anaerolineales bacterium]MCB0027661.1 alpha/beta hydrolase [Anaerolineales bacterium]MCB8960550.1 alpha/beta hydrolase [Ardenticatenales bacterium]
MSIAIVGDNLIHYEAIGRGEPIIFVHGWLGSWRYWWPSMQALSTRHRTFAFDLWGWGDSSKQDGQYAFNNYVRMLDQFMDKLGIMAPATLVGHSLGAAVSLRFACDRPDRVKRLVTVALPVEGHHVPDRLTRSDPQSFITRIGKGAAFPEVESEAKKTDVAALNSLASEMQSLSFAADLARVTCPTLIVFGDRDTVVTPPNGEHQHLLNSPGRHYIALNDCSHFPMLDEPVKFNRLIQDFITSDDLSELAVKEYWSRRTY